MHLSRHLRTPARAAAAGAVAVGALVLAGCGSVGYQDASGNTTAGKELFIVSGGLLAVSLAGDVTTLTAAMVLFGLGRPCFSPALTALVADATPRRQRGRAMGLLGAGENVGVMLGPVVVGFLWQAVGPRPAIAAAAGLCAVGVPVALWLLRRIVPTAATDEGVVPEPGARR